MLIYEEAYAEEAYTKWRVSKAHSSSVHIALTFQVTTAAKIWNLVQIWTKYVVSGILLCILILACNVVNLSNSHTTKATYCRIMYNSNTRPCKHHATSFIHHKISNNFPSVRLLKAVQFFGMYVNQPWIKPAVSSSSHLISEKIGLVWFTTVLYIFFMCSL